MFRPIKPIFSKKSGIGDNKIVAVGVGTGSIGNSGGVSDGESRVRGGGRGGRAGTRGGAGRRGFRGGRFPVTKMATPGMYSLEVSS